MNFKESSHEHVVPTKFHSFSTSRLRIMVRFISQHLLWNQYAIPLQALELHRLSWFNLFSKAFIKIYYFRKFHCQLLGLSKVTSCSVFNYFLTNSYWTTSATEFIRIIFRSLLEYIMITTNFLKYRICNTSVLKLIRYLLFSTIKDWGLSNSDQTVVYWKDWMLVNKKSF